MWLRQASLFKFFRKEMQKEEIKEETEKEKEENTNNNINCLSLLTEDSWAKRPRHFYMDEEEFEKFVKFIEERRKSIFDTKNDDNECDKEYEEDELEKIYEELDKPY